MGQTNTEVCRNGVPTEDALNVKIRNKRTSVTTDETKRLFTSNQRSCRRNGDNETKMIIVAVILKKKKRRPAEDLLKQVVINIGKGQLGKNNRMIRRLSEDNAR